jgi:superfamily II DNA/RNA helicase
MLFSATMPPEIIGLATANMKAPIRIEVAPAGKTADGIDQEIFLVKKEERFNQLEKLLKEYTGSVLIFCRTKRNVKTVADKVIKMGHKASEIHSNRSQSQRQQALNGFKRGMIRVLVATDIAARGIDVSDIQLVVNFDLPDDTGDYVHRIGRTARAGKTGKAVSFAAPDQIGDIRLIERLIRKSIPVTALGGLTKPAFVDPTKGPYSSGKRRMSSRRPTVRGERGEPRYLRDEKKPFARKSFDNTRSSFSKPAVRSSFGKASLGDNTFAPKKESFVTAKPSEFAAKKEFSSYPKREFSAYPKRESSGYPKRESSFGDRSGAPRRFDNKRFGGPKTSTSGFVDKKDAFSYDKRSTSSYPKRESSGYPKRESSYGDRSSTPRTYGAKRFGSSSESSYGTKREGGYGAKREGSYGDRAREPRSFENKRFGSSAARPAYKKREDGAAAPAPKLFSDRERFRASMRVERPSFGAKRNSTRKPSYR